MVYEDTYVKVAIITIDNSKMQLVAYNKSDTIIYVDKESSFAYTNNVPLNLYQKLMVSQGNVSTTGIYTRGLGLNTFSVGGVVDVVTTIERDVIPVAPHWLTILYEWNCEDLLGGDAEKGRGLSRKSKKSQTIEEHQKYRLNLDSIAPVRTFSKEDTPLALKAVTKYSLDKDLKSAKQITIDNYVEHIVVDDPKGITDKNTTLPSCEPYKGKQCVKFKKSMERSSALLDCLFGVSILGVIAALIFLL